MMYMYKLKGSNVYFHTLWLFTQKYNTLQPFTRARNNVKISVNKHSSYVYMIVFQCHGGRNSTTLQQELDITIRDPTNNAKAR